MEEALDLSSDRLLNNNNNYRQMEDEKAFVSVYRVVNCTYQNVDEDNTVQNSVDPTEFHSTSNNDLQKIVL